MKPFKQHTGIVAPLDIPNVDTDQIVPKQFLKRIERSGYGEALFYDWRFDENGTPKSDFILNQPRYQKASILLARHNFGCGSSREHAPWALLDYGFRVLIAPSFADIFYNNALKNGLLPVGLPPESIEELFQKTFAEEGYQLTVDLTEQRVTDDTGFSALFSIDPFQKDALLRGLDEIALTLQHEDKIRKYEKEKLRRN